MNKVVGQIEKIRLQLLDLGLRGNTLLHFSPRGSKHIAVVDEKSVSVFDLLVTQSKSMSFLPRPEVYDIEDELPENGELPEDYEKLPPLQEYLAVAKGDGRFEDLNLQTALSRLLQANRN